MIKLGDYNLLTVVRFVDFGLYLDGGETVGEILMPTRYIPKGTRVGDQVEALLYLDQQERLVATTEKALATVGQFAWLEVAWTNEYGAFLHWGPQKDLFCPFREQKRRMERGRSYIVRVVEDPETRRLMATAKVERYLETMDDEGRRRDDYRHGTPVDALVWQKTPLGFKVIVDNRFQGQLYDNQLFRPVTSGDRMTAYVDHIRNDGKIDLTLQPTGHAHAVGFAETLLRYLYEHQGRCELGDRSPAELIYDRFKVSKKVYKQAVGDLYRRRIIVLSPEGIALAPNADRIPTNIED